MFLIRLVHLKKIPKLEELLRNLDKFKDSKLSDRPEELPGIKNSMRDNDIKETIQSKDQMKNIIQEKKEILDNENENNNLIKPVLKFDDLISLCLKHKEMKLKYDLEKNVSLVKFLNGQIEFSFNENIDKNFIKNLSRKLFDWTNKRWIITLSKEKGQPTHQEVRLEKKYNQLEEAKKTNAYKKIKEMFSDAELIELEEESEKK